MVKQSFNTIHNNRKAFLTKNLNQDHVIIKGNNNILISAPHGVSQVRLGKYKPPEIGSIATALFLQNKTNCFLIAKTKNNNDDANFDDDSNYKNSIEKLIQNHNIKYVIDIHGLAANRGFDVNLGTHLGKNIEKNEIVFENLVNSLIQNNFVTSIDNPFMGGLKTISGSVKNKFNNIFTLQIEINCSITNKAVNINKYNSLLNVLVDWLEQIKKIG